jgi:hypothetical protein
MLVNEWREHLSFSPEWWPEALARIVPEVEGAVMRGYIPCALLMNPCGVSAVVPELLPMGDSVLEATKGAEWWIRHLDACVAWAEEQGHAVVALVCVGFEGEVLVIRYLDYPELWQLGIWLDDLEEAAGRAVGRLKETLGLRQWSVGWVRVV